MINPEYSNTTQQGVEAMAGRRIRYGVVGSLGPIAGADLLLKMIRADAGSASTTPADIAFEQRHFDEGRAAADADYDPVRRKFYVYNVLSDMEKRDINIALVPCFVSHSFMDEIRPELGIEIVSLFEAIKAWLQRHHPKTTTVGVLTSTYVRKRAIFEAHLGELARVVMPSVATHDAKLMPAIYGKQGLRAGRHAGECIEQLVEACSDLIIQGAEIIVPGMTEISPVLDVIQPRVPVPIVDVNAAYAEYALGMSHCHPVLSFKLGVLGGVGPAATVDFLDKLVKISKADRDQDHIKIVVEQNPQIPDRTDNLIDDGEDPTIAILSACRTLEKGGAHAIAIPCNTAHAFVERVQKHIGTPIVNMLEEVLAAIAKQQPQARQIGLLATTGTIQSGVYKDVIEKADLSLLTPDEPTQARVMTAIYGEKGVKAGYRNGECADALMSAINHLSDKGAEVIILGCTELPLIELPGSIELSVPLFDPSAVLARRCTALAEGRSKTLLQ